MALTPADVEGKTFGTALRGYDLDEVDDFLDDVVGTLRGLQDQLADARATPLETTEPPVVADESAVGRALIAAQAAGDSIISDAREESERILDGARGEAETWAAERDAKKAEADVEMAELTDHVSSVRTQLALLATSVADRLDEMDEAIGGSLESTESGDSSEDEAEDEPEVEDVEAFSLDDDSTSDADMSYDDDASSDNEDEEVSSGDEVSSDDDMDEASSDEDEGDTDDNSSL